MLHIGIQHLALELIQEIVLCASQRWDDSPSKTDLTRLRLISRSFRSAADPFLFSEITFNFVRRPLDYVVEQLNDIAAQTTPASRYTRTLDIQSTEVQLYGPIAHGKFGLLLLHAVKALHNVRSVRWNLERFEGMYTVLDGLAELSRLEEIHLNFSSLPQLWQTPDMMVLRRFGQLRSIKIRGKNLSPSLSYSFIQQLRRINQTHQLLDHLEFDFPWILQDDAVYPHYCILHEMVKDVPTASPLKLKHLRVHGWNLRLDAITIPHLRNLSHLDISEMKDQGPDQQAHVWNVLNGANIHLRTIRTEVISQPFLRYLLSYSGLEDLTITSSQTNYYGPTSETLVSDLYKSALPAHKDALRTFKALNRSDVEHCVTPDYMESIRTCERLEALTVTVKANELDLLDVNRAIIIMALDIPSLRVLDIDYSRTRRIGHRCQCRNLRVVVQRNKKFEEVIDSLDILKDFSRSLDSCQLIFNRSRYIVKAGEDGRVRFQVKSRLSTSGKVLREL